MDCALARPLLADHQAGRLDADRAADIAAHLDGCASCRHVTLAEGALDQALTRLPLGRAPAPLMARLEHLVSAADTPPRAVPVRVRTGASLWMAAFVSACAAAALVLLVSRAAIPPAREATADLVNEVVNDHLRVVVNSHPVEIESGGIHQVKPWFTGRLDFAPRVTFSGSDDFPLQGGSVGYVTDRKAAVFLFKRRLHAITLLVFPPDGLRWPAATGTRLGPLTVTETTSRGFSVLLWRDAGLGYALVSDVNVHDLQTLASQLNAN